MSGLCAIVTLDGRPVPSDHVERMVAAAAYRGPDGVGHWRGGQRDRERDTEHGDDRADAHLAYQALHVTPESTGERQPVHDRTAGVVLMADVRLDDREGHLAALRELVPGSPLQASHSAPSDVDIVLASYLRWGDAFVERLLGDFALVVYEPRRRRLVAARDPMGMRPLFYKVEQHRVLVASEVAQILAVPDVDRRVDDRAVAAHLLGAFDDVERTAYEGIAQVPPGHVLVVENATARLVRGWDPGSSPTIRYSSEEAYADRFREILFEAVHDRLRSVKPVGIQLSGGMDSGAVASSAGRLIEQGRAGRGHVRAYAWAFDELVEADERQLSDRIARRFGLESIDVPADEAWPLRDYPKHGPSLDDPFMGVYQVLLEMAAQRACEDGTGVILSGARGDLLVGTNVQDQLGMLLAGRWLPLREDLRLYRQWKGVSRARAMRDTLARPALATISMHPAIAPLKRIVRAALPRRRRSVPRPQWVSRRFLERVGMDARTGHGAPTPPKLVGAARRERFQAIFLGMQMKSLVWDERIAARAGLALADPWSDRRLAEFVLATPQWVVQRLAEPKRLAREAMRGVMPEDVRTRVGKTSPAPLYRRALEHRARTTIEGLLTDMTAAKRGYLDEAPLRAHYDHIVRGAEETPGFWWALSLEMWLRRYHAA